MGHLACQGFISIDGALFDGSSASLERHNKTLAGAGGLYAPPTLCGIISSLVSRRWQPRRKEPTRTLVVGIRRR